MIGDNLIVTSFLDLFDYLDFTETSSGISTFSSIFSNSNLLMSSKSNLPF